MNAPMDGAVAPLADLRAHRRDGKLFLLLSGVVALALVAIALLVPYLPLQDAIAPDYENILAAPSSDHWLGTDLHGRDVLSRVLWAARPSLFVGIVATSGALLIGMLVGGSAGYHGGWLDTVLMRTADAFFSFPVILGAIAFVAALGPGLRNVFLAIIVFGWPLFARMFRSAVLSVKKKEYVAAARTIGASHGRIFFRYILPDSVAALISYAALSVAGAIMIESGLSFINLGIQRPDPSWGLMLSDSMGNFEQAPWLIIAPGLAVSLTALVFMFLGTTLSRDTGVHS
jgi:ABC-type dipeptide/oligopeptide/nickel transport system permease subunit